MRLAALNAARGALLAGPTALAFFTGGYTDTARAVAGAIAWALAAVALALAARRPLGRPARLALAGIGGLAAWTALSAAWAPLPGDAYEAAQLPALYAGALLASVLLLREDRAWRWAEPAVAAGALVVVAYALSERLAPGLLEFERTERGSGRLEQPLTYWNALGMLAALGLVVCASLLADATRARGLRVACAAAAAPLGMALYLTVSRGALLAFAAGLAALVLAGRRREHLRAAALVGLVAVLAAAAVLPFDGVASLQGELGDREREGLIVLALLAAIGAGGALAGGRLAGRGRTGALRLPRHTVPAAALAIVAGVLLAVFAGGAVRADEPLGAGADRYARLDSNRHAYWDVAADAFLDEPVAGLGAAGWAVRWRQEREIAEGARDVHSLPLQTAAELGIVGVALLLAWFAGVVLAARTSVRRSPEAAGLLAGCVVWVTHASLDWDFQLPAATLPAVLLAGALLAQSASATRGASRRNTQTANAHTAT